jgi:hypothetical protein
LTITVALVVNPPPVPATVTVKVPGEVEVQERVDAPWVVPLVSVMLVGDRVQVRPDDGEMADVRVIVAANPLRPVNVMTEFPVPPEGKLWVAGLATTVKSWTV